VGDEDELAQQRPARQQAALIPSSTLGENALCLLCPVSVLHFFRACVYCYSLHERTQIVQSERSFSRSLGLIALSCGWWSFKAAVPHTIPLSPSVCSKRAMLRDARAIGQPSRATSMCIGVLVHPTHTRHEKNSSHAAPSPEQCNTAHSVCSQQQRGAPTDNKRLFLRFGSSSVGRLLIKTLRLQRVLRWSFFCLINCPSG